MVELSKLYGETIRFDYTELTDKIKEVFGKQGVFAAAMRLSERSVSLKLNNARGWTQQEMRRCCDVLMVPYTKIPDYFFTARVQKCE